jgi:hypothetical protein
MVSAYTVLGCVMRASPLINLHEVQCKFLAWLGGVSSSVTFLH